MGLKKLYYKLEDKYYNFVERTGLYKITDKIDKVMPSFILFLLLIIIIIAGLIFFLTPLFKGTPKDSIAIDFVVKDADSGALLEDIMLQVVTTDQIYTLNTNQNGKTEKIDILKESYINVDVVREGYENYSEQITLNDYPETITIVLEPETVPVSEVTYSFNLIDSQTNNIINRNGAISFKCLNNVMGPGSKVYPDGEITIKADPACDLEIESLSFNGYVPQYGVRITSSTFTIPLTPQEASFSDEEYTLVYNIKNSAGDSLSNIKIQLSNSFGVLDSCTTSSTGVCTFENILKGEYSVSFSDQRSVPIYSTIVDSLYLLEDRTITKTLSSDVKGYIYVRIIGQGQGVLENAEVSIKSQTNNVIETKYSDVNGLVTFTVPEIKDYNVVVDAEGYLIKRESILATETMPANPKVITLVLITPQTLAPLSVRVLDYYGKGYKFARVVLFDADTGFLTDYKPVITNYDGNAVIQVSSGNYIAKAIKGSSQGESMPFEFNVKFPDDLELVTIPMEINEGTLKVLVVDKEDNPVPFARIDLYDRYSYYNFMPAVPIKSELTNSQGIVQFLVDADNDYYVVATDTEVDPFYGKTQSRFVRVLAEQEKELKVSLYNRINATQNPRMEFVGVFKEDQEVKDSLKVGEDYRVRYNLLVSQNRTGDDIFEEIGFMIRTGTTSMIENDNVYIKEIDVPYLDSILKYTQFNLNAPHESEGFYDSDSLTEGNFKWAKGTLKEGPVDYSGAFGFYNVYEIEAVISVKDIALFGEEIKIYSLGYGLTEEGEYQTFSEYLGPNENIEYFDVYETVTYGVGDELVCSTDFCFSSTIVDVLDDLRYDVKDSFAAFPNKEYKYTFTLINNSPESRFLSSRFIIENIDQGLDIKSIKIIKPNGEIFNQTNPNDYSFDISITELKQRQKVTGEIVFVPKLKDTRNLSVKFISDQQIKFINQLFINVSSEKEFSVSADPEVIPSGTSFNLLIKAKDLGTNLPVESTTVTIKDKFKDIILGPVAVPMTGEITLSNIPAQGPNDKIYIYVSSPEYQTNITEMSATDRLFTTEPRSLSYSLNVFKERERTENFKINNISPIDLTIKEIEVRGENLSIVDVLKINNSLLNHVGTVIEGLDTISDFPENSGASKELPLSISLNPRADALREMASLSAKLHIVLTSNNIDWITEIPITVNVGFDGMLDNSTCLTISQSNWKEVSLDAPVDTSFIINNTCTIGGQNMALSGGLEARVMFETNPQGRFLLSIENRNIELTHGNYRQLIDTVDREKSYSVILRYEPVGRMKGTVKGKIQFRSINSTGTGNQELISELDFEIDVTNLRDCAVFSKNSLNIGHAPDEFTIENKACPTDIVYRLSCDDCKGIIVEPRNEITVPSSGTSESIVVRSMDAVPGAYILNVYSHIKDSRQSERLIKRIKVYSRPTDYCLDLERYEFDLYRSETSESTGLVLSASAYDTTNIINYCYGQKVEGSFDVKDNAKWQMAFTSFLRDGLMAGTLSGLLQGKILGGLFKGKDGEGAAGSGSSSASGAAGSQNPEDLTDEQLRDQIIERGENLTKVLKDLSENLDNLSTETETSTTSVDEILAYDLNYDDLPEKLDIIQSTVTEINFNDSVIKKDALTENNWGAFIFDFNKEVLIYNDGNYIEKKQSYLYLEEILIKYSDD